MAPFSQTPVVSLSGDGRERACASSCPIRNGCSASARELANRLHEHGIDWWDEQLTEYQALPPWKDFPGSGIARARGKGGDTDPFWLLTSRSMQYAWGGNAAIQMIKEVADNIAGHGGIIINRGGRRLGIADGDWIEVRSPLRATQGRAVLREGIRPDTF